MKAPDGIDSKALVLMADIFPTGNLNTVKTRIEY